MNSAPPPLPSTENGTDRNSFSRPAAKASAIAPFLAIGLLQLYNLKNQAPRGQLLLLGIDLLACLLIVVGVILGILALICMKSGGRGTIIFRATAGILLSSLLLAIALPNFLHAREKALAERKMYQQVQSAAKDFQSEAVAAVKEGRSADLSNFKQSLDNAGKNLT